MPWYLDQAQGAAQAIEDAACLATVLPRGTPPDEIPERLELLYMFRAQRTAKVQEYSRLMGRDWIDDKAMDREFSFGV